MLECKNIYFKYENTGWLLENIDISIEAGDILGLMGKSGIGKTTLARILAGYLSPVKGEVLFEGERLPEYGFSPVQLIQQHPEISVNPRWRIKKILGEVAGYSPGQEIIERLAISRSWFNRYPHELSGGELQRICVARILDPRIKLLICDEISGMLDAITQAQVWNTIMDFSGRYNTGLLIISHDKSLLDRLCSRTVSL